MLVSAESVAVELAEHRRAPNGEEHDPTSGRLLMWATCACGWAGPPREVVLRSPRTAGMVAELDADHDLHVAEQVTRLPSLFDLHAEAVDGTIYVGVQLVGETTPGRPVLVVQEKTIAGGHRLAGGVEGRTRLLLSDVHEVAGQAVREFGSALVEAAG